MKFGRLCSALIVSLLLCSVSGAERSGDLEGRMFYTKVNIWYEDPSYIPSTNYHQGGMIPAGTRVKIVDMGAGKIAFLDRATGLMTLVHVRRHSRLGFDEVFDRYFSSENIKTDGGPFQKLTDLERRNVLNGKIAPGMSKEAVIMAFGYPPSHRTPKLSADTWLYWLDRRKTMEVRFDSKGKVAGNRPDSDAGGEKEHKFKPVGKEYFTAVNIWYEEPENITSLNFHSGAIIPAGTKVKITVFDKDRIGFSTDKPGHCMINHSRRYTDVSLHELFWQYFTVADPREKKGSMAELSDTEKQGIQKGVILKGMSKKAVLAAYGYPPTRTTPVMDHHIWKYLDSRSRVRVVYFRNDKVFVVDPPLEDQR